MIEPLQPMGPIVLCMENADGVEVDLRIEPQDSFQDFIDKSKSILGYDVDLNLITRNQTVSLSDNIYQFLITMENASQNVTMESLDQIVQPENDTSDLVYILDDGTQIRASQIHFDNDDPLLDLTAEKIPFVKYTDDDTDDFKTENVDVEQTKKINIVESPVSHWSSRNASPKCSFVNSLPFKLVCNNTSGFEAQFTKYLESRTTKTYATLNPVVNRNKSPKSLIRENYQSYDDKLNSGDDFTGYTREEILNMFKDSPVASLPSDSNFNEKRKHARKTNPSRVVHKSWNAKPNYTEGILIGDNENRNCFICDKFVGHSIEKLYLFDNEDQKLHRSSPQKKCSRQLKIICERCLGENFRPCRMKGPNQSLNPDEYLVIRNKQQYIFQKTNEFEYKIDKYTKENSFLQSNKDSVKTRQEKEKVEFVKVEIGSDGEIVTKPIDHDLQLSDDIVIVKDDGKNCSSDVEIVEIPDLPDIDDIIVDNLDDADEHVKEFLGKYQCENSSDQELKCRFCERIFQQLCDVMDHVDEHKHDWEEGVVYPCPICEYGYANSKWLKSHVKAAHERKDKENIKKETIENVVDENAALQSTKGSPIAKRTRSSIKKIDSVGEKESSDDPVQGTQGTHQQTDIKILESVNSALPDMIIKTEVKQEALDLSEDEIWIVQTGDETNEQLESLLNAAKESQKGSCVEKKMNNKCLNCSHIFPSEDSLKTHKCKRRGRKRKSVSKEDGAIRVPTKEDFIKRAQGRPKTGNQLDNNDLLVPRTRRKKTKVPTSDPQIVTCHNCNEFFTSKVRLKFHMQFHETTALVNPEGQYKCAECDNLTFTTETELFDHVHFRHDKQRRWQCPVRSCGKTFHLRATLTKHSRTHTDTRRYACVTCGKRFLDKQTLDEHGVTHLQIKPFQCHICLKQLTRRSRLRMHLRAHEEELTPKLVRVCVVCSRAFRDGEDAQEHATKSTECIEAFTKELKVENEDVTAQLSPTSGLVKETVPILESPKLSKPIPCQVPSPLSRPLLNRLPDEARALTRVVQIEKAFRCEYCEDVFYLEDGLNMHRVHHKGVKNPFTCHICKVSFATYSRCTTHKTTHGFYKRPLAEAKKQAASPAPEAGPSATGILGYGGFPVVKHFLCEDCGRSYLHWTYLQVHRRMKHANDNFLYRCNQCDVTFPNSWSLAYHRKKIHGQSGQSEPGATSKIPREDYRIPCRDCDEILPNKTALYKHRKKEHSDMSLVMKDDSWCSTCGKEQCGRGHNEERDGVSQKESTAIRNHRLVHTGVRAWACSRCPKRFRIRSDLRTHSRLKHPAYLAIIEINGLNPSPDEVRDHLRVNNISHDSVIEITKMSFLKGSTSIIPTCARALAMLGSVPRTPVAFSKPANIDTDFELTRGAREIDNIPPQPKVEGGEEVSMELNSMYPELNVSASVRDPLVYGMNARTLTDAEVQMLLTDSAGAGVNEPEFQIQMDNNVLE